MSLDRALLKGSPAKVTWNGATMFSREAIRIPHAPEWQPVETDAHGTVDKVATDLVGKVPVRLWGAWESLSVLFPSVVLTPTVGSFLPGPTDLPLVVHGVNTDRVTYHNAYLTRVANLFLGVGAELFAADVEFTWLLANSKNPEEASSYYTVDTFAYTDATFAKTNFRRQRYSAAWTAIAGFTSFQAQKGWNIEWDLKLLPVVVDGLGTVSYRVANFLGRARGIPVEPTMANIEAASKISSGALGRLLSVGSADLVITGTGVSVTLKNAGLTQHGYEWGLEPLRNGELGWETTVGFAAGVAATRAVIA